MVIQRGALIELGQKLGGHGQFNVKSYGTPEVPHRICQMSSYIAPSVVFTSRASNW